MIQSKYTIVVFALICIGFALSYTLVPTEPPRMTEKQITSDVTHESNPEFSKEGNIIEPIPETLEPNSRQVEESTSPTPETLKEERQVEGDPLISDGVCHIPFQIGTYETVTTENAVSLAFPILKSRNSNIKENHLKVQDTNGGTRLTIAREFFVQNGEDNYCVTWEENNSCIGQWIYFDEGKMTMEAQNPC